MHPFEKNSDKNLIISSIVLFLTTLIVTLIITFNSYRFWLNSDMTAEIIAGQEALKEGGLLSKNWYYGTELRLITPTIIYEFLLLFTDNFFVIRCISIPFVLLIYLTSIYFLIKELNYKKYYFLIATFMLLPLSVNSSYYVYVVSGYQMYAFYLSFMFISISLSLEVDKTDNMILKSMYISLIYLIAVLLGLNSPRHLLLQYIPLFLGFSISFFITIIRKNHKYNPTNIKSYFFILLGALICNILSTIVYVTVLSKDFNVFSYSFKLRWPSLDVFKTTFTQLFYCLGLNTNNNFFGVMSNITFILSLLFIVGYIIFFIYKFKTLNDEEKAFSFYSYIALIIPILFFLFIRNDSSSSYILIHQQYYLLGLVNFFFLVPIFLKNSKFKKLTDKKNTIIKYILTSSYVLIGLFSFNKYYTPFKNNQDIYNVATILNNYDYKKGYASHWNGQIMNEIVKSRPEMYVWKIQGDTLIENKEVQSTRHDNFIIDEKCFAIFSNYEAYGTAFNNAMKDSRSVLLGRTQQYYLFGLETGKVLFEKSLL